MPDNDQAIARFLKNHLDAYIAEVAQLCAQPSVSARQEGTRECAELIVTSLRRHGLPVSKFETPGNPIVVGHADGTSDRTLLFYNHYDVQPPEPLDLWSSPPFQPTVRNGALYARGAKDDKGEFVARLAAVDAIRAVHDGILPCHITFVVEGEEEISSPHIAAFVREHLDLLKCHGSIWEEGGVNAAGQPVVSLGSRGILYVQLSIETLKRDAHSGSASVLPNAAWQILRGLASLKGSDERILIPGFYDEVLPPSPRDLELLAALPSEEPELREQFAPRKFVRGVTGAAFNRAVFEPTCNIAGLSSGYQGVGAKTIIPAHAVVKVDFRLVPNQDPDDIFAKLRKHLDDQGWDDVVLTRVGAMWPCRASPDDPLVRLSAHAGEAVYGLPAMLKPMNGGSSPRYAFAGPLGDIPIVTAGVGYPGSRTHSPDEHVRLVDFVNGARHIARILDGFADASKI